MIMKKKFLEILKKVGISEAARLFLSFAVATL